MKIITSKRYDIICDIVMSQKRLIEQKEAEIKRLKAQVNRLSYLLDAELKADDDYNTKEDMACLQCKVSKIDFPNSHSVIEPSKDVIAALNKLNNPNSSGCEDKLF